MFDFNISVTFHTGSGRNKLTDNNIFLKSEQMIHLALNSRLGKNLGCLLERCCGKERLCEKRSFCDTKKNRLDNRLAKFGFSRVNSCLNSFVFTLILGNVHHACV